MRVERMRQASGQAAGMRVPGMHEPAHPERSGMPAQGHHRAIAPTIALALVAAAATAPAALATPRWRIEKPVEIGAPNPSEDAPLRKEEAAEKKLEARYPVFRIDVEGHGERTYPPPRSVEQRFADVLNRGNPEVEGGEIRHGVFYDGLLYWGSDPLSFIWLNIANHLRD